MRAAPTPGRPVLADHFPHRAHNQSMNTLSSRALPLSLSPLVPQSLGPLVPWSPVCTPPPPLRKSPEILRSLSRKTHGFNRLSFLSVNYPVNFNPEKTPLSSPKGPALGAKRPLFRPFRARRRWPLDNCRATAHPLWARETENPGREARLPHCKCRLPHRRWLADHFPRRAHSRSINSNRSRAPYHKSHCPSVPIVRTGNCLTVVIIRHVCCFGFWQAARCAFFVRRSGPAASAQSDFNRHEASGHGFSRAAMSTS